MAVGVGVGGDTCLCLSVAVRVTCDADSFYPWKKNLIWPVDMLLSLIARYTTCVMTHQYHSF